MTDTHCRHCDDDCDGWSPTGHQHVSHPAPGNNSSRIEWDDGHCPMCHEVQRIAAWLRDRAARHSQDATIPTSNHAKQELLRSAYTLELAADELENR